VAPARREPATDAAPWRTRRGPGADADGGAEPIGTRRALYARRWKFPANFFDQINTPL